MWDMTRAAGEISTLNREQVSVQRLKAGTEDQQHIIGIEQKAGTTKVHLVYLVAHGDNKI